MAFELKFEDNVPMEKRSTVEAAVRLLCRWECFPNGNSGWQPRPGVVPRHMRESLGVGTVLKDSLSGVGVEFFCAEGDPWSMGRIRVAMAP